MKYITTILIILTCWSSYSQGLNVEIGFNEEYSQLSKGIVAVDEFTYFVKRQQYTTVSLNKIDTLGNLLWSSPITPETAETMDVFELIPSENGGVYLLGYGMFMCDVGGGFWFVQKYNSDGTLDWTKLWDQSLDINLTGLSLNETNDLLVNSSSFDYGNSVSESKIYTLGTGGALADSLEINQSDLEGISDLNNYEKIAYKQDSIYGYDINGNATTSLELSSNIQDIKVINDTLYALTQDSLYRFDSNLLEIDHIGINGYSDYSNLKVDGSKVEFLSQGLNNQYVISLDHQLTLTNVLTIPLVLEEGTPKDFNDLHFATSINFSLTLFTSVRYLDFSLLSNQNSNVNSTDIGIIDVLPTQVTIVPHPTAQDVYEYEISVDVMLKNYGNNVLNDCRINHLIGQAGCVNLLYSEHFSNLNLAPNDSMWISLGIIHTETGHYTNGTMISPDICVYTSHPNFQTDLNVLNDEFCKTVMVGYADLEEEKADGVNIFPNPAKTTLYLELNTDNLQYTIYNMQGIQIKKGNIDSKQIGVSELSSGMYMLVLSSKDGSSNYKKQFVKE